MRCTGKPKKTKAGIIDQKGSETRLKAFNSMMTSNRPQWLIEQDRALFSPQLFGRKLDMAISHGYPKAVKKILQEGADPNMTIDGKPLVVEAFRALLSYTANDRQFGIESYSGIEQRMRDVIVVLIQGKADLDLKDDTGKSARILAKEYHHLKQLEQDLGTSIVRLPRIKAVQVFQNI
jgi:hypothetical protein